MHHSTPAYLIFPFIAVLLAARKVHRATGQQLMQEHISICLLAQMSPKYADDRKRHRLFAVSVKEGLECSSIPRGQLLQSNRSEDRK